MGAASTYPPEQIAEIAAAALTKPQALGCEFACLIEPWRKVLRSLAPKGRRSGSWADIERAITGATAYWNAHRHPCV